MFYIELSRDSIGGYNMGWDTGVEHDTLDAKEAQVICDKMGLKNYRAVDFGIEIYESPNSTDPVMVLQKESPVFDMDGGGQFQVLTYAYFCEIAGIKWYMYDDYCHPASAFHDGYESVWKCADMTKKDMDVLGLPFNDATMLKVIQKVFKI